MVGGRQTDFETAKAGSVEPEAAQGVQDERLAAKLPQSYCAEIVLTPHQSKICKLTLIIIGIALLIEPIWTLRIFGWMFWAIFATLTFWRLLLILTGLIVRDRGTDSSHVAPPADTSDPIYSILVPVYKEAGMMVQLSQTLRAIDWPEDRLDIQILVEYDDAQTLAAAEAAVFPQHTRLTVIPPGPVRTKPHALNYGLSEARGDFICIFDAEDRPHPQQLKAAYDAFQAANQKLACVQAPLIAEQGPYSWLAEQWALEYAVQYGLLVPALAQLNLPLPIGGTSNHFKRSILIEVGGWDMYNVTEDADLGGRLARFGYDVSVIRPETLEDAPTSFSVWTAQRSRWVKGFMQTWCVVLRNPGLVYKQLGLIKMLTMQLNLTAAILAPLFHGPVFLVVLIAFSLEAVNLGWLGWGLLISGYSIGGLSDLLAPGRLTWRRLFTIATRPFYWPLHSLAAVRAVSELVKSPYLWAKTPHTPRPVETG